MDGLQRRSRWVFGPCFRSDGFVFGSEFTFHLAEEAKGLASKRRRRSWSPRLADEDDEESEVRGYSTCRASPGKLIALLVVYFFLFLFKWGEASFTRRLKRLPLFSGLYFQWFWSPLRRFRAQRVGLGVYEACWVQVPGVVRAFHDWIVELSNLTNAENPARGVTSNNSPMSWEQLRKG